MSPTPEGRVLFFAVLRKNARKLIPAFVGLGAVIAGFLFLFVGFGSPKSETVALAADRSTDQTANRGSGRGLLETTPQVVGTATAETSTTEAPVVDPTSTTEAPTTTTAAPVVVAAAAPLTTPPTTAAPKPKVTTTTTAAPVTTAPPVTAAPAPVAAPVATTSSDDAVWQRLAKCESGNRNDTGAPYYGYFQFSAGTWTSVGGAGLPSDNSYEVQLDMAKKLQARSGWGQWPVCSKVALAG